MSYVSLGAPAALTAAEKATRLRAAVQALPPCYSQELDNCLANKTPSVPQCDVINAGYEADRAGWDAVIDRTPFCSAQQEFSRGQAITFAISAGFVGLVLGLILK